jgi:hypothetical protein
MGTPFSNPQIKSSDLEVRVVAKKVCLCFQAPLRSDNPTRNAISGIPRRIGAEIVRFRMNH